MLVSPSVPMPVPVHVYVSVPVPQKPKNCRGGVGSPALGFLTCSVLSAEAKKLSRRRGPPVFLYFYDSL